MARQGNIPADFVINSLAVLVWIAWAQLMWAVLWETIVNVPRLVSGRRWRPPPLVFAPVGDGVARLFSVMLAVGVLSTTTPGATPALAASSGVDVPLAPTSLDLNAHEARTAETLLAPQLAWTVTADDDLWSIAEQALGDGARVDDIIALNPGISARSLRAGTVLQLPSDATVPQPAVAASVASPELAGDAAAGDTAVRYVVQENDGMWNVAEALLGDGSRHTELHELLAGQEVAPGVVFTADTYVIHPGWEFTLTPSSSNGTAPNQGRVEHVVERGESLWSIAEEELGEAERWPEIWEAEAGNVMEDGRTFDDPNLIQPGWRLDVPRGNAVDAPPPPLVDAPSPASDPVAEETEIDAGADSAGETGDVDTDGAVGEGQPSSSDRTVDVSGIRPDQRGRGNASSTGRCDTQSRAHG